MSRKRTWAFVLLSVAGLGLAGCSGTSSAGTSNTSGGPSASGSSTTPTTSAAATTIPVADRSPVGTTGTAPTVVVPAGPAPASLESADLIAGAGAEAKDGDMVTVQYVLATYSSGKVIQSSWTGQPFSFTLGAGQVIPGWDQGVVGMKVGGRRELIIPPNLGYGDQSPGTGIAANDTLVFVIDLLKVG